MPSTSGSPKSVEPHPYWYAATMAPNAAAVPSRLSRIALRGIAMDRNIAMSRRKLAPSTNATTTHARDVNRWMRSIVAAWSPVTWPTAPVPARASGMISARRRLIASSDRRSPAS